MIVNISLPLPLKKEFSYILPDEICCEDLIGKRALVPFGKRILTGFITGLSNDEVAGNLKEVIEIIDNVPAFSADMLKFTKWISDYYMCSWGEALKASLPQGMSPKSILTIKSVKLPDAGILNEMEIKAPKRFQLLTELIKCGSDVSVNYLEKLLKTDSVAPQLNALEELGYIELHHSVSHEIKPAFSKTVMLSQALADDTKLIIKVLSLLEKRSPKQFAVIEYLTSRLSEDEPVFLKNILKETGANYQAIISLEKKGYIEIHEQETNRALAFSGNGELGRRDESLLPLTDEQESALSKIQSALYENSFRPFLLHGVTGSGKTLVYIHLIKKTVLSGKSALLLVPEISLTPQMIDRFRKAFPEKIAVLHSKMSEGERFDAWRHIRSGECQIVIGARSAIFAPLVKPGLIIVDEEHEPSYKQISPAPRYNARDAAVYRARLDNSVLVLGSATPSLESFFNARTGKYELIEISGRADGARLPEIVALNFLEAQKRLQTTGSLTNVLLQEIVERVKLKQGVILFQNRRGYSSYLECPECGFIPQCKNCDVSLTYHKKAGQLRCHYCGYVTPVFNSCGACGNNSVSVVGFGTQRIEDELGDILKSMEIDAKIERMDLDTTSKKGAHRDILERFAKGEIDILVGTQMVAKGLDFAHVTLVGVINADTQLFLPDFRASERTFQLLTQVSGRAGRTGELPGQVIIQTSHPENIAVLAARNASYLGFYAEEIYHRQKAAYPPFWRFSIIEVSGKNERSVVLHSEQLYDLLKTREKWMRVLGPVIPTMSKLKNEYRRILILKNDKQLDANGTKFRKLLNRALEIYYDSKSTSSVKVTVDIDSYSAI